MMRLLPRWSRTETKTEVETGYDKTGPKPVPRKTGRPRTEPEPKFHLNPEPEPAWTGTGANRNRSWTGTGSTISTMQCFENDICFVGWGTTFLTLYAAVLLFDLFGVGDHFSDTPRCCFTFWFFGRNRCEPEPALNRNWVEPEPVRTGTVYGKIEPPRTAATLFYTNENFKPSRKWSNDGFVHF